MGIASGQALPSVFAGYIGLLLGGTLAIFEILDGDY
jgi:hypothetical protein